MTTKTNQTTVQTRDAQIVAGIGKHLQNEPSISLLGTTYAPGNLTKAFQAQISALATLAALKAQVKAAVAASRTQEVELAALSTALKTYLVNEYGKASPVLSDFGFAPRKATQRNPVTKVIAAARNLATRKERGTMGPVQKAKITGTIPATIALDTKTGETSPAPMVAPTAAVASNGAALRPAGTQ
jgi:hypothetical protein